MTIGSFDESTVHVSYIDEEHKTKQMVVEYDKIEKL